MVLYIDKIAFAHQREQECIVSGGAFEFIFFYVVHLKAEAGFLARGDQRGDGNAFAGPYIDEGNVFDLQQYLVGGYYIVDMNEISY